jgi:hypothetical protein
VDAKTMTMAIVWIAAAVWCMACMAYTSTHAYTVARVATFDREEALEWAASAAIACAAQAAILFPMRDGAGLPPAHRHLEGRRCTQQARERIAATSAPE